MNPIARIPRTLLIAAAAVAAVPVLAASAAAETTRHTLAGDHVAVYNLVGSVEIVRGTGSSIVAEVTTKGPDARRLEIAEGKIRDRQTLRVIYPGDRIQVPGYGRHSTSTFRVRDDGTFGDSHKSERDGRRVVLSGSEGIEASADIRITVPAGKRLDVYWGNGRASATDVEAELSIDAAALPVDVTRQKGTLHVDVGSGDVRVSKVAGSVDIDTGSGSVDIVDIKGRTIRVDTGSGTVTARDLEAGSLSIDTGSGSIEVAQAAAPVVSLETGSGGIAVVLTGEVNTLEVDSGSGNVIVTLPRSVGARLSVETGSGGIESELPIETRMRSRRELVGTIGDGSGQIAIETGSGNVTLREGRP